MARSHLSIVCIMSKNGSYFAVCHHGTLHFCSNFSYTPIPTTPSHLVSPFMVFTRVSAHAYFWLDRIPCLNGSHPLRSIPTPRYLRLRCLAHCALDIC